MGKLLSFPARTQSRQEASLDALFELEVAGEHLTHHGYADGTVLLLSVNAEYGPDDIVACRGEGGLLLCCPCEGPLGTVVGKVVGVVRAVAPKCATAS